MGISAPTLTNTEFFSKKSLYLVIKAFLVDLLINQLQQQPCNPLARNRQSHSFYKTIRQWRHE